MIWTVSRGFFTFLPKKIIKHKINTNRSVRVNLPHNSNSATSNCPQDQHDHTCATSMNMQTAAEEILKNELKLQAS